MANKTITYPSGTVVRRKITGDNEVWELEGKSLCTSEFKIDLSQCEGIKFDDKSGDLVKTITVKPLEAMDMFGIVKKAPFTFKPVFHLDEKPIPLKEQKKHTEKERKEIEAKVSKMEEAFKTLPFEVMPEKDLKKQIKKLGIGHFVDPHFPPRDTSIH